jgi:hypothetical protein
LAVLSASHRAALTAVIQACPDAALARLGVALAALAGAKAAEVAALAAEEARDRARRNTAFAPLAPLFQPRADGAPALTFPPAVLARVWRAARQGEEDFLGMLDGAESLDGEWTVAADRLCARAAAVLRDRPDEVWADFVAPADDGPPSTPQELAGCFDLTPLVRQAVSRLPAWLERPDDTQLAGLRLLIQDANAVAPDGGRRMIDILFAHVADAERMLRVVTRTSRSAGNELVLSHSEMGVFVERLLASIQARVRRIGAVRPTQGEAAMAQVVEDVAWCAGVLAEMDVTLQLRPESPWGKTARMARIQTAGQISALIKSAAGAVHAALPMKRRTIAGRMTRLAPWVEAPAHGEAIEMAITLLNVVTALRGAAAVFGCEGDRAQLKAEVTDYLSTWANEALDGVGDGEVEDVDRALRLVGVAARLLTTMESLDAARAVRRRAAAAETARATSRPGWNGASPTAA